MRKYNIEIESLKTRQLTRTKIAMKSVKKIDRILHVRSNQEYFLYRTVLYIFLVAIMTLLLKFFVNSASSYSD